MAQPALFLIQLQVILRLLREDSSGSASWTAPELPKKPDDLAAKDGVDESFAFTVILSLAHSVRTEAASSRRYLGASEDKILFAREEPTRKVAWMTISADLRAEINE